MHKGQLTAYSEGTQRGATFVITLPTSAQLPLPKGLAVAHSARRPVAPNDRLLLVEDHRDTGTVMKRLLQQAGYQVDLANSIKEALALAMNNPYRLLLSDIGLPDGSGLELMRKLRESMPIRGIALSGFGMEDDIRRSKEAGFSDHITKPVDIHHLVEQLARLGSDPETVHSPPIVSIGGVRDPRSAPSDPIEKARQLELI
jgi:CheY-like chemotaxis protein